MHNQPQVSLDTLAKRHVPRELYDDLENIEEEYAEDNQNHELRQSRSKIQKERTASILAMLLVLSVIFVVISGASAPYLLKGTEKILTAQQYSNDILPLLTTLFGGVIGYYFGVEAAQNKR